VATTTVAQLGTDTSARLQDPEFIFWQQTYEVWGGIAEALNEMMLMVARPTIQFSTLLTLTPNTVWQQLPSNMIAITDMRTNNYRLWKTSLYTMDKLLASWSSDWTCDRADQPQRWGPLGMTKFFVHPAPIQPIQVIVAGVCNPISELYPPTGSEQSPFHSEFDEALSMYSAAYCRFKDLGDDAQEGFRLYQQFLGLAQRLTVLEDRKDALTFAQMFGMPVAPSHVTAR
jgi:hypothetical protein